MKHASHPRSDRRPALTLARAAAAALALAAGGCDTRDAVTDALDEATLTLNVLNPNAVQSPAPDFEQETLTGIVTRLRSLPSSASAIQKASASLLIARAQLGLAQRPAAETAALETDALGRLTPIRALAQEWLTAQSNAALHGAVDVSAELAASDRESADIDRQIAEQRQKKSEIERQVAALRSAAAGRVEQSRGLRQQESQLRQRAVNESATQAAGTIAEAEAVRRSADALDAEAAGLDSEAGKVAPSAAEVDLRLEMLGNQRDLVGAARQAALDRQARSRALAAEAAADAAEVEQALTTLITEVADLRSGPLADSVRRTIEALDQAAGSARAGKSASRQPSELTLGDALQTVGDAWSTHARGLAAYAATLDTLANTRAGRPDAAELSRRAGEARAAQAEALAAAWAAYQEAYEAYGSAGSGDRVETLRSKLSDAVKAMSDGAVDLASGLTPEAAPDEPPAGDIPAGDAPDAPPPTGG